MSTPEQNAPKMEAMTAAIMAAIGRTGDADNIQVIMGSLGSVVGCMARASGQPDKFLDLVTQIARGVISSELLD